MRIAVFCQNDSQGKFFSEKISSILTILENDYKNFTIRVVKKSSLFDIWRFRNYDLFFIYRELSSVGVPIFEWLIDKLGIAFVYYIDDANLLKISANRKLLSKICKFSPKASKIINLSKHVVVQNNLLKELCERFNPDITVLPVTEADSSEAKIVSSKLADIFRKVYDDILIQKDTYHRFQFQSKRSFGFQWNEFNDLPDFTREHFLNYLPVKPPFFEGKVGLDAGCGFGRHIYYVGGEFNAKTIVGMDFSDAVYSAKRITQNIKNIQLIKGDIYNPPFRGNLFDFIYCIGVLHHLPDPEKGFKMLLDNIKENGVIMLWVYSKQRKILNSVLEFFRKYTSKISPHFLKKICFILAFIEYLFFIDTYRLLEEMPIVGKYAHKIYFDRIALYSKFPFRVSYADWFDRLSTPIRFYYDREELETLAKKFRLKNVTIAPTGKYGWKLYGEKAYA